jgi:hypothetical protein
MKSRLLPPPQDILLFVIFLLALAPIHSNDFWWHLKLGQLIAAEGAIPSRDVFHFTAETTRLLNFSWGSELFLYALYSTGGFVLLILFRGLIILATFALIVRICRLRTSSHSLVLFILIIIALNSADYWFIRPELFTFLFFAVTVYLVERSIQKGGLTILALPCVAIIWVNCHHGFLAGILYIVLNWIALALHLIPESWETGVDTKSHLSTKWYHLSFFLTFIALIGNPFTYHSYLLPFRLVERLSLFSHLTEWQSPDFASDWPFIAYMFLFFLGLFRRGRRADLRSLLIAFVFLHLALTSRRHIFLFCVASIPVVVTSWSGIPALFGFPQRIFREKKKKTPIPAAHTGSIMLTVLVLGWGGRFIIETNKLDTAKRDEKLVESGYFPVEGCTYLMSTDLHRKLFVYDGWGGYILWHLHPERTIYYDGRGTYGEAEVNTYRRIVSLAPSVDRDLTNCGISAVLFPENTILSAYLEAHPDWRCVFEGKIEKLFAKEEKSGMNFANLIVYNSHSGGLSHVPAFRKCAFR